MDNDVDYIDLIMGIVYVDDGGIRLSKAKGIGVLLFLFVVIWNMIFFVPQSLRISIILFLIFTLISFLLGLFLYAVCRGLGYLIRSYFIK